jgi:toxin YhaV
MSPADSEKTFHGWTVLFSEPFLSAYGDLSAKARKLKNELPEEEYEQHPDVKLFLTVRELTRDIIPSDPHQAGYRLHGDLSKFRRIKGRGLPGRYRLFWVFSEQLKVIIFLYLNDSRSLRKEGDRSDPYRVFSGMVGRGEIGTDFEENYRRWQTVRRSST